jgi:hypothetical protein
MIRYEEEKCAVAVGRSRDNSSPIVSRGIRIAASIIVQICAGDPLVL